VDGATGSALQTLASPNPEDQGFFGRSVARLNDTDDDGIPEVMVGAPEETVSGTASAGRAYIFDGADGSLQAILQSPNVEDDGQFGFSVTGLLGTSTVRPVVAAHQETVSSDEEAGRAYLFEPAIALTDGRNGTPYSPSSLSPGSNASPVGRFSLSAGATGSALTNVTVSNFAPSPSGVTSVELWTSPDASFEPQSDTQVATESYDEDTSFSGLSTSLGPSPTYFFVVVDLDSEAGGSYEPVIQSEANIGFTGAPLAFVNGSPTSIFTDAYLSTGATNLPVELAAFDANVTDDRSVRLQWQTTSETGNSGFRVQRSVSGTSWSTLGRVEGAGTTDEPQSYRFTDSSVPYASDSLQYRLAQVDVDGTANFSDPVTVRFGNPDGLELLGSFPNPARSQATVRFAVPDQTTGDVQLELYDLLGRQVKTIPAAEASGRVEQTLDVSDLPSGTYLLRLSAGSQTRTQQVTIVR
jgi:hypothetical protein